MDSRQKKELKSQAHKLQPTVRIGKSGLTEQVIEEIKAQMSKRNLIKIKVLGSDKAEVKQIASDLTSLTGNAEIVDVRGNTIVLWKQNVK